MGISEYKEWLTLICSFAAACAGAWNYWWEKRGKHDRFMVRLGGITTRIEQESMMSVVSLSDHPIKLKDWGFIEPNGMLSSMPLEWEAGWGENFVSRGGSNLDERNTTFEAGYVRDHNPMGAYAVSITQIRPSIYFDNETPYLLRIWIRLRLWIEPNYYDWKQVRYISRLVNHD